MIFIGSGLTMRSNTYSCPGKYSDEFVIDLTIWEKRYVPKSTRTPLYIVGGAEITPYNPYALQTRLTDISLIH